MYSYCHHAAFCLLARLGCICLVPELPVTLHLLIHMPRDPPCWVQPDDAWCQGAVHLRRGIQAHHPGSSAAAPSAGKQRCWAACDAALDAFYQAAVQPLIAVLHCMCSGAAVLRRSLLPGCCRRFLVPARPGLPAMSAAILTGKSPCARAGTHGEPATRMVGGLAFH